MPPGGAVEQAHAQALLQLGQPPTHGWRRDPQLLRGCRQAGLSGEDGKKVEIGCVFHS